MLHMVFELVTIMLRRMWRTNACCYRSSGHICVLWALKNYGSAAILISLFKTSKHVDFLYNQLEKSLLELLSVIRHITKPDEELFPTILPHWPHKIFFLLLLKSFFWFI